MRSKVPQAVDLRRALKVEVVDPVVPMMRAVAEDGVFGCVAVGRDGRSERIESVIEIEGDAATDQRSGMRNAVGRDEVQRPDFVVVAEDAP